MKECGGSSQRTHRHDPWTQTALWGKPGGKRGGLGGGGPRGVMQTSAMVCTTKIKKNMGSAAFSNSTTNR